MEIERKWMVTGWPEGLPMVAQLEMGLTLEVNLVDEGQPGCFWYAEVEFETEAQALAWKPEGTLATYLSDEVTGQPGQSMGAYWAVTRLRAGR